MGSTAKLLASEGINQITVVSYRAIFIVVAMGVFLYYKFGYKRFILSKEMFKMYLFLGILTVVINVTGFMMSCAYLSVPKALILHYAYPLVTMAGAAVFLKEKPSAIQVMAGFLVLVGLYVGFVFGKGSEEATSALGLMWGGISLVGISGQTLLSRRLGTKERPDPMLQLFYCYLFGGSILIVLNTILRGWSDIGVITPRLFLIMQYPAFLAGLVGYGFLFSALKYISASTASLICSLEVVFAIMLAPLIVKQNPSVYEVVGALIVLTAVISSMLIRGKR